MLSGNDEITRLNRDDTTTMNLVVASSRVLHVLTCTGTTPVDSPSCIQYVQTMSVEKEKFRLGKYKFQFRSGVGRGRSEHFGKYAL